MLKPKPYGPMALDDYAQRVALALQYVVQADLDHRTQEVCFIPSLIVHAKAWGATLFQTQHVSFTYIGAPFGAAHGLPPGLHILHTDMATDKQGNAWYKLVVNR